MSSGAMLVSSVLNGNMIPMFSGGIETFKAILYVELRALLAIL